MGSLTDRLKEKNTPDNNYVLPAHNPDNQVKLNTSSSCTQHMRNTQGLLTLFNRTGSLRLNIYILTIVSKTR